MVIYIFIATLLFSTVCFTNYTEQHYLWIFSIPTLVAISFWRVLQTLSPVYFRLQKQNPNVFFSLPGLLYNAAAMDKRAEANSKEFVASSGSYKLWLFVTCFTVGLAILNWAKTGFSMDIQSSWFWVLGLSIWIVYSFSVSQRIIRMLFNAFAAAFIVYAAYIVSLLIGDSLHLEGVSYPYALSVGETSTNQILLGLITLTLIIPLVSLCHYAFKHKDRFGYYGLGIIVALFWFSSTDLSGTYIMPLLFAGWMAVVCCWIMLMQRWRKRYWLYNI